MSTEPNRKLFAGIDWASKTHAICIVDDQGAIRVPFEIPNTCKTFTGLIKRLTKLSLEGVTIERGDGPLVDALLDTDHQVFVITPRRVKGLRSRCSSSGAKSDVGDAYLLADVLRTDGRRLPALHQDSDATQALRPLSRTRKQLVEARDFSPWAGKVHDDAINRANRHPDAVRILARARVRVIWRCWQDNVAYGPELHGGAM